MPDKNIIAAKKIFTGEHWLSDMAIICANGEIREIVPAADVPAIDHADTILPAFIDLQIYGAAGKLLSVYPSADTIRHIHQYCINGGAFWFQPTVATNTTEVIHQCIDAVREYRDQDGEGCIGLHVEGPWISKAKRGAHIESLVHTPSIAEVRALLEYGNGVITMITLAPEVCSTEITDLIHDYGVVVSAGHTNCSFSVAKTAFNDISTITHLYNAMTGLQHREPGVVGAAFLHPHVKASIIADGHHVDYAAIRIAQRMMQERLFLITDAVTETNEGAYPHQLQGDKYVASGILSGSALTMMQAVKNMISEVGVDATTALKMATSTPASVMGLRGRIASVAEGAAARFIISNDDLEVLQVL